MGRRPSPSETQHNAIPDQRAAAMSLGAPAEQYRVSRSAIQRVEEVP
jgi:hypothetical protein